MTIYMTGGHLTPALAVIDALQKKYPRIKIIFFGREKAQTQTGQLAHEKRLIEERGIQFVEIDAPKFHRTKYWLNIFEFIKILPTLWKILQVSLRKKPDAVLSFGGYVAFPVCLIGKLRSARVITHEQTKVAGLANLVIARYFADTIAVANEESLEFFPKEKTIVTGNPIRDSLFREYKTPPSFLENISTEKPLLYVTGGSQGSQIINQTVVQLLPRLLRDYIIVHQCGTSVEQRYVKDLEHERSQLPEELQHRYIICEWIEAKEVSYLFRNAKFVISRAGANTVQELTLVATPAIFIPLAFAYNDEQFRNIEKLLERGSSLCVLQKDLVPETLAEAISTMERNYDDIHAKMDEEQQHLIKDGTKRVIDLLLEGSRYA